MWVWVMNLFCFSNISLLWIYQVSIVFHPSSPPPPVIKCGSLPNAASSCGSVAVGDKCTFTCNRGMPTWNYKGLVTLFLLLAPWLFSHPQDSVQPPQGQMEMRPKWLVAVTGPGPAQLAQVRDLVISSLESNPPPRGALHVVDVGVFNLRSSMQRLRRWPSLPHRSMRQWGWRRSQVCRHV